jgi:hypothetical protein
MSQPASNTHTACPGGKWYALTIWFQRSRKLSAAKMLVSGSVEITSYFPQGNDRKPGTEASYEVAISGQR